ncbi:amino acid ABC transporter permease [Euzebya tangerina]|uniref:amino acid ABC transporter permease n=1 Tax=Euzebya tangerina TaxID=591198 RepID=UPI00196A5200|nr:amino acid ABC transporter permease [Euzebya tangerina]
MTDTAQQPPAMLDRPDRVTPSGGDTAPKIALALGAFTLIAAPVVIFVVNVGIAGALVPIAGVAAWWVATQYGRRIDYSPPGDGTMRQATMGKQAGLAGLAIFVVGGLISWSLSSSEQLSTLQTLFFDLGFMADALPTMFFEGLKVTMIAWIIATVMGQILGTILALMRISRVWLIRNFAVLYIDIFRGLPAILTIVLIGFALPLAGIRPVGNNPIFKAAFALGLVATAYVGEIVRSGIQSIDEGQMEAARSLGMPHREAMRLVIVPQGLRRVVPPLTNEYIALLKDTSLIFVVGLAANATSFFEGRDLYRVGTNLAQQNGNYSAVVLAGIFYLLLTVPLTRLTNYLDDRLREGRKAEARQKGGEDDDPLEPGLGMTNAGGV